MIVWNLRSVQTWWNRWENSVPEWNYKTFVVKSKMGISSYLRGACPYSK